MSWANAQYIPEDRIVQAVLADAIAPVLTQDFERMSLSSVQIEVTVWENNTCGVTENLSFGGLVGNALPGQVRLRFRRTFKPERSLFFAQLRLAIPIKATGYSGCSIRGTIKGDPPDHAITVDVVSTEYNMNRWRNP